jgi:hypothetical protein
VNAEGKLVAACNKAGFRLIYRRFNNEEELLNNLDDSAVEFLASFSGEAQRHLYLHHRDQQILMTGIILLSLTKQVTPEGYSGWMTNRIRSFSGSLGISTEYICRTTDQYPDQECMIKTLI